MRGHSVADQAIKEEKAALRAAISTMINRVPPGCSVWSHNNAVAFKAAVRQGRKLLNTGNLEQLREAKSWLAEFFSEAKDK